jgi:uncharacterized membrane protein
MLMDGEKKFVLLIVGIVVLCLTVLYSFLFIALWPQREWVGLSLFAVLVALAGVYMRGRMGEQDLRQTRYDHRVETPLDGSGEPVYWHQDAQVNPHRLRSSAPTAQGSYQSYQGQQSPYPYE